MHKGADDHCDRAICHKYTPIKKHVISIGADMDTSVFPGSIMSLMVRNVVPFRFRQLPTNGHCKYESSIDLITKWLMV